MGKKFLIAAVVATVVLGAGYYARSDLLAAGNSQSRYVLKDTGNGFLRLDTKTGEMSMCQPKANSFVCKAVADDREALEKEIARLEGRVGVLKRYIKKSESTYFKLPSDKEVDQVLSYFEGLVKRFRSFTDFLDGEEPVDDSI